MKNKKVSVKGKDNAEVTLRDLSSEEIMRGICNLFKNDIDNGKLIKKISKVVS